MALCFCLATILAPRAHAASVFELPGALPATNEWVQLDARGDAAWLGMQQQNGRTRLVRVRAGGATTELPRDAFRSGAVVSGTDDGGFVAFETGAHCNIERRDAASTRLWRVRLADECTAVVASGNAVWAQAGGRLRRIGADGTIEWSEPAPTQPQGVDVAQLVAIPGGDVVRLTFGAVSGNLLQAQRIAIDGTQRWRVVLGVLSSGYAYGVVRDGTLVVVGSGPANAAIAASLRLDDGAAQPLSTTLQNAGVPAIGPSRAWLVEVGDGGLPVVHSYRLAGGGEAFAALSGAGVSCRFICRVIALEDGSAMVFARSTVNGIDAPVAFRLSTDGTQATAMAAPGFITYAARLSDGSHVLVEWPGGSTRAFAVSPTGTISPIAIADSPPQSNVVRAAAFAVDGWIATIQGVEGGQESWSVVDASGALRWSRTLAGQARISDDWQLADDAQRSCGAKSTRSTFGASIVIACRSAATGEQLWDYRFDVATFGEPSMQVVPDGSLVFAMPGATTGRTSVLRFTASGALASRAEIPAIPATLTAGGRLFGRSSQGWTTFAADGSAIATSPAETGDLRRLVASETGDAFAVIVLAADRRTIVRQYDGNGAFRSEAVAGEASTNATSATYVPSRDGVFMIDSAYDTPNSIRTRFIRASDGAVTWQRELPLRALSAVAVLPSGDFALVATDAARVQLEVLSRSDGSTVARTDAPCESCGQIAYVDAQRSDTVRVLNSSWLGGRTRARVFTFAARDAQLAPTSRAIAGGWYPDYFPGEGLVATLDPEGNTLFAAWFTYARPFAEGDAGLHWYSLQGTASATATSELVIYENRGGAFAQPPATSATNVGRAMLRLVDCSRSELDYEFTGEPVLRGRRTLTRLTDPGHCGGGAPAPRAGLDWRQSGGWFEPATAGQGVLFSIAPDAPVFGAWFTYDVAGRADDPAQQQWLTLQSAGVPSSATNIALDVYRTTGGEFDVAPAAWTTRIGSATLTLDGCTRATLSWRFDASASAGALAGASGQKNLERLGACPP